MIGTALLVFGMFMAIVVIGGALVWVFDTLEERL